jgi:predicted nuclease of restriction endonuclease-like (RecB) superfamily
LTQRKSTILFKEIRGLILDARGTVAQSANLVQVWTNYHIGRIIVEFEQKGTARAAYAERQMVSLSNRLTSEFGRGFSKSNLEYFRRFFLMYHHRIAQSQVGQSSAKQIKVSKKRQISQSVIAKSQNEHLQPIAQSVIGQLYHTGIFTLSWTHYLFLMSIDDEDERSFYEIEAAAERWSVRELRRQFNSSLYERLALSRNKKKVKELAKKGQILEEPQDAIKEPIVLEFLGLDEKASYTESTLESAIIDKIEHFLLEMGKGFLFEARQKRLTINDKHFHVDLVLYNRLLRCYVLIDLKIGEITHQDLGQMQMYVNYMDRNIILDDENPTVGIILCRKKEDALVEITLPKDNKQIFASRYKLYLPSKAQLRKQVKQVHISEENNL